MSFRNIGIAVAVATLTLTSGISAASAHSRHDHHRRDGYQGGGHKQKVCYDIYPNVRCFYR